MTIPSINNVCTMEELTAFAEKNMHRSDLPYIQACSLVYALVGPLDQELWTAASKSISEIVGAELIPMLDDMRLIGDYIVQCLEAHMLAEAIVHSVREVH